MTEVMDIVVGALAFVAALLAMIIIDDRPQFRFSLRSLLIAVAFATVVMALVATYARFMEP